MDKKKMGYSILIVDDDIDLAAIISDMYEDYGYQTKHVTSAMSAYEILETNTFDMILLDINLPKEDGFCVCKEIRKVSKVPIVFASARTSEDDKINGLDIGGDDYLPKPYSLKELLSRTNSLLRRTYGYQKQEEEIILKRQDSETITIDSIARVVKKGDRQLNFSLKEFDVLLFLAKRKNEVVSKEEILKNVWGTFFQVEDATLNVHIRWIREKIEVNPSKPNYIKTVRGIGYCLEDETKHG